MTATQICGELNRLNGGTQDTIMLSSLSGTLKRMYDAGELCRVDGYGPRGGYGYLVNHT
jgi:hypothetical protein